MESDKDKLTDNNNKNRKLSSNIIETKVKSNINIDVNTSLIDENNLLDEYDELLQEDSFMNPLLSPSSSSSVATSGANDVTFEPTVDMMVNDFDDEQTLNEEETLAELESHDPQLEIDALKEEADMPLEELLVKYQVMAASNAPFTTIPAGTGRNKTKKFNEQGSSLKEGEIEKKQRNRKKNKWKERSRSESEQHAKHPRKETNQNSNDGQNSDDNIKAHDSHLASKPDKIEEVILIESSNEKDGEIETEIDNDKLTENLTVLDARSSMDECEGDNNGIKYIDENNLV